MSRRKEATVDNSAPARVRIVYQDNNYILVDKPQGIIVTPDPRHGISVQQVIQRRTGIEFCACHMIDKGTSGLVLLASTKNARASASNSFQNRKTKKLYVACLDAYPDKDYGEINAPLNTREVPVFVDPDGKNSRTEYLVVGSATGKANDRAIAIVMLHTGRTHQIRVHMSHIGSPLYGDPVYNKKSAPESYQWLHSAYLMVPVGESSIEGLSVPNWARVKNVDLEDMLRFYSARDTLKP